ncbi:MAG: glutamate racemase [bacterium]
MIGIFDSGFGGLTIFKEIYRILPQYDYIYLGDNARYPYGSRSHETVYKFTEEAVDFLFKQGCELIILACGTASSKALRSIQQKYLLEYYPNRRVLGIIIPLVEEAVKISKTGRIGIAGTMGTVNSNSYPLELEKQKQKLGIDGDLQIFQAACPLLVPFVEEGWTKRRETKMILRKYLRPLKLAKIDTLILGCTHYPVLYKQIQGIMGKDCRVLNSGEIVAKSLADYLSRHSEMEIRLSKNGKIRFLTTDNAEKFNELGGKYFGIGVKAELVKLDSV